MVMRLEEDRAPHPPSVVLFISSSVLLLLLSLENQGQVLRSLWSTSLSLLILTFHSLTLLILVGFLLVCSSFISSIFTASPSNDLN